MQARVVALLALLSGACSDQVYEVPAGYTGWVEVDLGNPSCLPLRSEGGAKVVDVGIDGHGCTAEDFPGGLNRTRYFYVGNGTKRPIPRDLVNGESVAQDNVAGRPPRKYLVFFIGPKAEMRGFGLPRQPIRH